MPREVLDLTDEVKVFEYEETVRRICGDESMVGFLFLVANTIEEQSRTNAINAQKIEEVAEARGTAKGAGSFMAHVELVLQRAREVREEQAAAKRALENPMPADLRDPEFGGLGGGTTVR